MNPPRPDAKNVLAVLKLFEQHHPTGLQRGDFARLLPDIDKEVMGATLVQMTKMGRLARCGDRKHLRWFKDDASLAAASQAVYEADLEWDRQSKILHEQRIQRHEAKRAAKRAAARSAAGLPPTPLSVVKAKNPPPLPKPKGRPAGVRMSNEIHAEAIQAIRRKDAPPETARRENAMTIKKVLGSVTRANEVVIPDHVQIQRLPGFTCDPRWTVPDQPVIGGFASMGPGRYLDGVRA